MATASLWGISALVCHGAHECDHPPAIRKFFNADSWSSEPAFSNSRTRARGNVESAAVGVVAELFRAATAFDSGREH
jgi:hypothetical protein